MAVVTQLSIAVKDEAGALAEVCTELARVTVNISEPAYVKIRNSKSRPQITRISADTHGYRSA